MPKILLDFKLGFFFFFAAEARVFFFNSCSRISLNECNIQEFKLQMMDVSGNKSQFAG